MVIKTCKARGNKLFAIISLLFICIAFSLFQQITPSLSNQFRNSLHLKHRQLNETELQQLLFEQWADEVNKNSSQVTPQYQQGTTLERVAVCISGAARTLPYEGVYQNILETAIQPIRSKYNADVFFLTRLEDEAAPLIPKVETNVSSLRSVMQLFNPVKVITYNDIHPFNTSRYIGRHGNAHSSIIPPWNCSDTSSRHVHFSHSLFRTKHCLQIIKEHEQSHNFKYNWIYRIRPDVVMYDNLTTPDQLRKDTFYTSPWSITFSAEFEKYWKSSRGDTASAGNGALGDQFFVGHRDLIEVAFNAFDIVNQCEPFQLPVRNSESILRFWLVTHSIKYQVLPVLWDIIRDFPDNFCFFMEYVTVDGTTFEERKQRCLKYRIDNLYRLPR